MLDFRALERIPPTTVTGSVGGETQLRGVARVHRESLTAPKSGTTSVYYRYTIEREETDSDGDRTWRTIRDESRATDFLLADNSGSAVIRSRQSLGSINWAVAQKYRRQQGDLRYTEWRIDPGDRLTIFGWLEPGSTAELDFSTPGRYLPIVSSRSASEERGSLGMTAILMLSGSIAALVFATLGIIYALRVHRTLVFLTLLTVATTLLLFNYGIRSLATDIAEGAERLASQRDRTQQLIGERLASYDIDYPGLEAPIDFSAVADADRRRIEAWQQAAWVVRERFLGQIKGFPENVWAAAAGVDSPAPIALSPGAEAAAIEAAARFEETRTGYTLLFSGVGALLVILSAWLGFRAIRTKRMQENLTTSKSAGVVFGLTEVEGTLEPANDAALLTGPLSGEECVWYRYTVDERRGTGKNARWVRITDTIGKQPFFCRDDEGSIRVFPSHAEIITRHRQSERRGSLRYGEWRLEPGDDLYVMGKAQVDKTSGESLVIRHSKDSDYIIANESEAEVMFRKAISGMFSLAIGISILFFCALWIGGGNGNFSSLDFLLASFVAPGFLGAMLVILMYNDLVFLRQRCERNWANIQVSLKKRATLIPQLESVVRRFLEHETDLQETLADMRTLRSQADSAGAVDRYMALETKSLAALNANFEAYPELRGDKLAAELNRRMIKLENEVALIRSGFNDAVMQYRIRLQTFPDSLVARVFRFQPMTPLSFSAKIREVPDITG